LNAFTQHLLDIDVIENIEATLEKYKQKAATVDEEIERLFAKRHWQPDLFEQFFEDQKKEAFDKTIEAWKSYRQEKARFAARQVFGANWAALDYYKSYIRTSREMIESFSKTGTFY
jgi:hypothetical protein